MANARLIAVNALIKVNKENAYSNITLDKYLSCTDISDKDKALATTLFYGVLDRKITIDYVISKFSKTPVKKLSPITAEAIRIAIYQLLFLERIPESAAVNESVNIVKRSKEARNSGFVNAVLRNIIRNPVELPSGDSVKELSVRYSCPEWIIESFIADYGKENAVELLKSGNEAPPVILRVNTLKTDAKGLMNALLEEGITAREHEFIENALVLENGFDIRKSDLYKKGFYHIQDTASQLIVTKLSLKSGERVLDLCAAPGGKSFTMAEIMEDKGEIVACDLYEKRVNLIDKGAKRLGLNSIKPQVSDATAFNKDLSLFDAILCDVPCSGLGVLRRKPEIKYKNVEDFTELQKIQREILSNAVNYLKENGRILYSTCTLRRAENEEMIADFLKENKNFTLEYEHTFMPHIDGTDGFYCALLYKK